MDDLPGVVFRSEDARNPQGNWSELLPSADLGLEPLYLDEVRKLRCFVPGDPLEARELAVCVVGCGTLQSVLNRGPSTCDRPKWVSESHIVPLEFAGRPKSARQREEGAKFPPSRPTSPGTQVRGGRSA